MTDKKFIWGLLFLFLTSLACSGSILKPAPMQITDFSPTEQILPSPTSTITAVSTETPVPITCTVAAAESLHMRDTPEIKGVVITWLYPGDQLILLPDPPSGDWVKVQFGDLTGWIHSHYCKR